MSEQGKCPKCGAEHTQTMLWQYATKNRQEAQAMSEQPMPVQGQEAVTPFLKVLLKEISTITPEYKSDIIDIMVQKLEEREKIGIERYGTSLMTHNGRDSFKDLLDELYDALQYALQNMLERNVNGEDTIAQVFSELIACVYVLEDWHKTRQFLSNACK
jgi:hypothetical protein